MVKITNGEKIIEVTKGAFNDIYSRQGYVLASEYGKEDKPFYNDYPNIGEDVDKTLPQYDEKDITIPLSEMSVESLKQYAAANNINISPAKRKKEIIDIIVDASAN